VNKPVTTTSHGGYSHYYGGENILSNSQTCGVGNGHTLNSNQYAHYTNTPTTRVISESGYNSGSFRKSSEPRRTVGGNEPHKPYILSSEPRRTVGGHETHPLEGSNVFFILSKPKLTYKIGLGSIGQQHNIYITKQWKQETSRPIRNEFFYHQASHEQEYRSVPVNDQFPQGSAKPSRIPNLPGQRMEPTEAQCSVIKVWVRIASEQPQTGSIFLKLRVPILHFPTQ
jgi:hypothetical protein